ncbi:hypothetical protein AB0758_33000 [Tolypothrix bouteillei VB521301_2]
MPDHSIAHAERALIAASWWRSLCYKIGQIATPPTLPYTENASTVYS